MPKRKREGGEEAKEDAKGGAVLDHKQARLQHKINQYTVKLGHAFKVAKGFERQKLGRRQKTAAAEKNEKNIQRVEAEIIALKALNTTLAAQHHLYKTLLKIKSVAASSRLEPILSQLTPVKHDAATLNIIARLCSSKPAKEALNTAIEEIQQAAGISRTAPKRFSEIAEKPSTNGKTVAKVANPLDISDSEGGVEGDSDGSDNDFGGFDDRLAPSDSEDDGSDADGAPASKPKASSFVPSLSVGYIAGSDSEPETDIEEVAPKKNRRGQRARQQLAEKKFGQKAKHLQNPKNDRKAGWDPKRGATDGRGRPGDKRSSRDAGAGRPAKEAAPPQKKHKDDDGPLHPSWEAAKKAKEKKDAPVAFSGKKISFD